MLATVLFVALSGAAGPSVVAAEARAAGGVSVSRLHPFVLDLENAGNAFIGALTADQQAQTLFDFDDPRRTSGRDTTSTPAFCAALVWCNPWGVPHCQLSYSQQVHLNALLSTALSDSGYQTLLAVLNRNHVTGELEDAGNTTYVAGVLEQCPQLNAASIFEVPAECIPANTSAPPRVVVGGNNPPSPSGQYTTRWQSERFAPGVLVRDQQACAYALSMFGKPGDREWALRFEGHHYAISITLTADRDDAARYRIHASPFFLGSFPVIVLPPPDPSRLADLVTRTQGQMLLHKTLDHAVGVLDSIPPGAQALSHVPASAYPVVAPLAQTVPPPWLMTGLNTVAFTPQHAEATITVGDLGEVGRWHLSELFGRFFAAMPVVVGTNYRARLTALLSDETSPMQIITAGSTPARLGEPVFLRVKLDNLLIELKADNQWSVQSPATPIANHLHAVFRDLDFAWSESVQ